MPPRLAEPDDVDRYLRTQGTVSPGAAIDPTLLEQMLEAATERMIDARPERTLLPTPTLADDPPVEYRFPAAGIVQVPDLREVTTIRFDTQAPLASSDYVLRRRRNEPALWVMIKGARHYGAEELVISGHWGPADVRPSIREACIVWVARVFHQRTARFADNTAAGPDGQVLGYFRNLPPDVKLVLDNLQIPGV